MAWEQEYLHPGEFETEDLKPRKRLTAEEYIREINECIIEIDQSIGVNKEWERSNNLRMSKIRREQNLIRDMRCLP